jgi:two-component system sensor histidine kinase/response regulator
MARILVIEDSITQAAEIEMVLEEYGHTVELATDGHTGLARAMALAHDAIVSDIIVPGPSGIEICRTLKQGPQTRSLPVMLLTTLASPIDILAGLAAGADTYVIKPFNPDVLCRRLDDLLAPTSGRGFTGLGGTKASELIERIITLDIPREQILRVLGSSLEDLVTINDRLVTRETELARRNDELTALNTEKCELLGMAVHDLRNPIGVIKLYSEFLLDSSMELTPDQRSSFLENVKKSSEFMLGLVTDLLRVSSIESGALQLDMQLKDLAPVLEYNVGLNRLLAGQKSISIGLEMESPVPAVRIDPEKFEQILNNLLTNAVKFSNPGTNVTVRLGRKNGSVSVAVQDEGLGIPSSELAGLFRPFQRTSVRGTAGEPSTGLGLAIVKRIVEGHGGSIDVDSTVGKGTTFTVFLPVPKC